MATRKPQPTKKSAAPVKPIVETTGKKVPMGEVGFADPRWLYGGKGAFTIYNPDQLVTRKGLKIFDDMIRDDQVKAALTFKKLACLASGYCIEAPEGTPEDSEVVQFVENTLNKIKGKFTSKCKQILSALDYGYSISEKIWDMRDGKIVIADIKTRKPHDFTFKMDAHGNILGLEQTSIPMPQEKFLVYSHDGHFDNPYGRSDLIAAYRPWWTKDNAYKWMGMLLERLGIPPIFAMYDQNAYQGQQLEELKRVITSMQAATAGIIPRAKPEALEMWAPELAGQVSTVFIPSFNMLDRHIARALLMPGQIGLADESKTAGSYAKSQTHFDVFMLVVDDLRSDLEDRIQEEIIAPLVSLNYAVAEEDMPQFKFLPYKNETRVELLNTWAQLVGGKIVHPTADDERKLREMSDMPERDIPEDEEYGIATPDPGAGAPIEDEVVGNGKGKYVRLTDDQIPVFIDSMLAKEAMQ